ncbi:polyprenyl synthetase family protein [Isobaculum melis]|uniref:Heptaprenyl diphosphate synthase n=1 Tax=Isobaculum melis TaxID=142588 RepID=A0A1H9TLC3_9LACT|nr:polyprenyl synthetase family protein [Isobaculum melis]SER97433.1 heptaprenyl diphosphate synthase [Isobaculum melis]
MSIHPMWDNFPAIKNDLAQSYHIIEKKIRIRNKDVEATLYDLLHSGGKFLRPAYAILFSRFGNPSKQDHKKILATAASVEILHMATLIHDDVIDESPTRRGTETVQAKYGKDIAVYTGDFLFTVYFDLLADIGESQKTLKLNAFAMKRILLGELDQMYLCYNTNVTVRQYLRRVNGKTAQLFSLSCFEGAKHGKADLAVIAASQQIGRQIGIAFQILDDILDYTVDSDTMKKPVLEDVKQGVYSLPLILAMHNHQAEFEPFLNKKEQMTATDIEAVLALIKQYRGVEQAQALAERYTNKALKRIEHLPNKPEKEILMTITKKLLNRSY